MSSSRQVVCCVLPGSVVSLLFSWRAKWGNYYYYSAIAINISSFHNKGEGDAMRPQEWRLWQINKQIRRSLERQNDTEVPLIQEFAVFSSENKTLADSLTLQCPVEALCCKTRLPVRPQVKPSMPTSLQTGWEMPVESTQAGSVAKDSTRERWLEV